MRTTVRTIAAVSALIMVGVAGGFDSVTAVAQTNRYSSDWRNPDAAPAQPGTGPAQELVDELNRLIDSAAAARAADPAFIRDLRDLARRFDWPWRKRILFDDFSDGDVTANPAWTLGGAPVTVDRYEGLRSRVALAAASTSQTQQQKPSEEMAVQLLGQLLRKGNRDNQTTAPAPVAPKESILATSAATANQFAVQADIVFVDAANGYFEMGVIQGTDGLGYRVGIRPGAQDAAVEILRVGTRGSGVVDGARVAAATWGARPPSQPKTVLFTRDDAGTMQVSINGTVVLSAADRAFRERFDGFILRNGGGDYIVKSIAGYSN